ncbi:uncharacterized protein LOC141575126 [Camelus bactrianus]|uniref:Uncharacterized protein LOC141575126 n=1 Tax=Camelus bactrianus TaxID=9837 RepID=A0AC58PI18_CAMBA
MLPGHPGWPTCGRLPEQLGELRRRPSQLPPSLRLRRRGPGTRTPERKRARRRRRRTYRARLAAPPARYPAAAAAAAAASTRAARTHSTWPNSKEPGAGEGAPAGGAEWERGGCGEGEHGKCYNFLPCPPPGRGGRGTRRGEGSARGAPMSSLSFSPPRSPPLPSRRPPPASSLAGQAGPEFSVLGPRARGWRRRGRRRRKRESCLKAEAPRWESEQL